MGKRVRKLEFDEIGYWSQVKLDILGEYAKPYNEILHRKRLKTVYVDGFAGAGHHITKNAGELVQGSPVRAMAVKPPFHFFHFVDMDDLRTEELKKVSADHPNVNIHHGDANRILLADVFPNIRYEQFRRGLCILDPYGLDLDWSVIEAAGKSRTIEIFLNFPVMDMNRNVLWHEHERVDATQRDRMTRFWGDSSWSEAAYSGHGNLFGYLEKTSNEDVAAAFRERLKEVAGFSSVPEPIPMRNTRGAVVYYLFFAAHQLIAANIVTDIFNKYRHKGEN
jgi:three-Cys-motif partner protein